MTLHLTHAEAEQLKTAGSGVLFREGGIATSSLDDKGTWTDIPPAEFVEAAAACETCGGSGSIEGRNIASWDFCYADDCHDGKRRVAAVVPCDHPRCQQGRILTTDRHGSVWSNCPKCRAGLITVGHVVVTWGPDPVVQYGEHATVGSYVVVLVEPGSRKAFRVENHRLPVEQHELTLPPDVDPANLVGQYALGVEVVS